MELSRRIGAVLNRAHLLKHVAGVEPMPGTGGKAKEPLPGPWEGSALEGARLRNA